MALSIFAAGSFATWSPLVEWDGTNETEIRDWIRGLDPNNPDGETDRWAVADLTAAQVVFTRPATHPDGHGHTLTVTVPLHGWVAAKVPGNASLPGGRPWLQVLPVDKVGKWATADPYGRPPGLNDLLA